MKNILTAATPALVLLALLCSCRQLSESVAPDVPLNAKAIAATVEVVCARHDAYVDADPDLAPIEKTSAKLDSALLREAVSAALGK